MRNIVYLILTIYLQISIPVSAQEIILNGNELFGDMSARHIGPALMSGRITDVEMHPKDAKTLYIGTAGGGVWKSSNGGASFKPIFDEYAQSIGVVTLDPSNPDQHIWVGTGEVWTRNSVSIGDGLYHSEDGGLNWTKVGFAHSERISAIRINPENSNELYVGVMGSLWGDSDERGVYKSIDQGKSWEKILYLDETTGCADLVMDPVNPNILYASMWEFRRSGWSFNSGGKKSALYKTKDGGKHWEKVHNGFPEGDLGRIAIAQAPSNPKVLFAVLETEKPDDKGLYRSDDEGLNWTHLNNDFGLVVRPFYFSRIVVDPKNENVIVKAGLQGSISRDGGKTFRNLGNMHADIHDIAFDIHDSDRIFVATDGGVYRSWDGGTTMEIVNNIPVSQFYHISLDNAVPYNIYGGLQDNGSWYGPSRSPGGIEARDWNNVGFGDGFRVLKHRTKDIIYSEMQGAENVWRYDEVRQKTRSIQPLPTKGNQKFRFNWNAPIALSPQVPDRIYIGSQFLHKSEDMGNTWEIISPDLTTNDKTKQNQGDSGGLSIDNSGAENHCTIFTIAESALDQNVIWVGTDDGNVQITRDRGKTWINTVNNIPNLPKNTWCYHIEASTHEVGRAYAVFDGHTQGNMNPYIYRTDDFGKTWKSIVTDEIIGFARNIQEDYVNEDMLYLGTEFGLFISLNGGHQWLRFEKNMPATSVHYIELHPETNDLVLGTHGRGIIILDDISPLREIDHQVLQKNVHFFTTKPTAFVEESGFGGGSTELQFIGRNPSRQAKIMYFLKKRHLFGKMSLEIQDMSGKKLIDLPQGKTKGINIVRWNGYLRPPKVAKGKTLVSGGFRGIRVKAGTYRVVMNKGKETYETTIDLTNDPNSTLSDAERESNYNASRRLYDMCQELAYLVYEIDENVAAIDRTQSIDSLALHPIKMELLSLKDSLVVTTGDNYVGAAEPQLREKIAALYNKIASGFEPPNETEKENMLLLEGKLNNALYKLEKMKQNQLKKLTSYLANKNYKPVELMSFDEYVLK